MIKRQIIAIGGGSLTTSEQDQSDILRYIIDQQDKTSPRIGGMFQATAEHPYHINGFYRQCIDMGAKPTVISLFGRVNIAALHEQIANQDIIYVGGGNTKTMLAIWQAWQVDTALYQAYQRGCIMTGISAGAICWYRQAVTDSVWPLGVINTLNWLPGSICPHFDSEPERRPACESMLAQGRLIDGVALPDFCAEHLIDEQHFQFITTRKGASAYRMQGSSIHKASTIEI